MRNVVQLCLATNNILLMCKQNHAFLHLLIACAWKMADRFASRRYSLKKQTWWLNDETIIFHYNLLNSVIAKYHDLSVASRSIICQSRRRRQIIDLLVTDKSQFTQPCPIVVKCFTRQCFSLWNFADNTQKTYFFDTISCYVFIYLQFLCHYFCTLH